MASLTDSSSIFTSAVLDAFNELERLVARDGDLAGTQAVVLKALRDAAHTKNTSAGSGQTFTRRAL